MTDNLLRQTTTLTRIHILEIDRIRRKERDSEAMEVLLMREDRSDLGVPFYVIIDAFLTQGGDQGLV